MSIQIDWQAFTPISLVGGLMLGVATMILLLGIGRIAGISGIGASLLKPKRVEAWQVLFILGLIISPLLYQLFTVINWRRSAGWLWYTLGFRLYQWSWYLR